MALADFNWTTASSDAAVATESFDTVDVLLGNGDGTFQPLTGYTVGGVPESVVAREPQSGDGVIDIASADNFGTVDLDGDVSVPPGNCDGMRSRMHSSLGPTSVPTASPPPA